MKEQCVRCGKETEYDVNMPVEARRWFVEGAGQLCDSCWSALYKRNEWMGTAVRDNNMEYTLEMCSKYEKLSINGKPVVVFDEHNWALPVWGTYANRLEQPMNLISFDTHTDTRAPFLRYLCSEWGIESVPYDKSVLRLPQITELLNDSHYKINDYCFENVFYLADCIACDEQILTASVFGYLNSYVVIHKENDDFDDEQFGYDAKYIKHEEFASGNRPDPRSPLILDIDLDYFGDKKEIIEWSKRAEKYIKAAEVITVAREPEWVERCKTDPSFDAKQAEQQILKCIERVLGQSSNMIKTITTPGWPTIQNKINNLPPAKQELFNKIKTEYESEIQHPQPNHEKIALLMKESNELLTSQQQK